MEFNSKSALIAYLARRIEKAARCAEQNTLNRVKAKEVLLHWFQVRIALVGMLKWAYGMKPEQILLLQLSEDFNEAHKTIFSTLCRAREDEINLFQSFYKVCLDKASNLSI